jgi:hypothetical protein
MNLSLGSIGIRDRHLDRIISSPQAIQAWNSAYERGWNLTHHVLYQLIRRLHGHRQVGVKLNCRVVARSPNGVIFGIRETDMGLKQLAQLIQLNLLDTAVTVTDEGNTGRALTVNNAATLPRILAGTGATAAAFTDYKMQTWTDDANHRIGATINAVGSGTFTMTGVITNGSGGDIAYSEVGIDITIATYLFLLAHDVGTAYTVSPTGTLTVTYTWTFT